MNWARLLLLPSIFPLTKHEHADDVVEEGPIAKHIATDRIGADQQTAGMDVYHADQAQEQHQLVAGLLDVLLAQKHRNTGQVQYLV